VDIFIYNMVDLNSDYKGRPLMLVIAALIVAAVGVWCLIQGGLVAATDFELPIIEGMEDIADDIADMIASLVTGVFVVVGILTLLLAFLIFNGSRGGRTVLVIILVISILINAFALAMGDTLGLVELVLAIIVLYLLYRPNVNAYFKRTR